MRPTGVAQDAILLALENGDATTKDLLDDTAIVEPTLRQAISRLLARKLIHIHSWELQDTAAGRPWWFAIYRHGLGANKKKPRAKTDVEKTSDYRARQRARRASSSVFNLGR